MKVKKEYVKCDVCLKNYYIPDSTTEIYFSINGEDRKFDCCYWCISFPKYLQNVYKKIIKLMKSPGGQQ